jgi:multidrug efflux pump subunit AcrA (membrane-fusion protein)
MPRIASSRMNSRRRALSAATVACLAALGACRARKPNEIDRAPRADPTTPVNKPPLKPDSTVPAPGQTPPKP